MATVSSWMLMQVASPPDGLSGDYWNWQGQPIYYVKTGNRRPDRPPLLLVHGFGASTDHWRKNLTGLATEFEVWAIDLLGFGRSGKPERTYSADLWRSQLHTFIQDVIEQPVVIAGNSLGGYISLCVAAEYPAAVQGLSLLNSAGPFTDTAEAQKLDPLRQVMGNLVMSLFQQDWASWVLFQYIRQPAVIRRTLERVYLDPDAVTDRLVEEIRRPSDDPGADKVFAAVFRNPQGQKVDTLLGQLTQPLLMLWGEADPWMQTRNRGAKFRHHYPNLQEHYLRAGHCPHDELPDRVNQLLRDWVLATVLQP